MPFTNEAIRAEIQEWIQMDGSKVGRITSDTPLALNMHLVEVVWKGVQDMAVKPVIIYVCNTTLEAELLDRQLKDRSFHGGKIGERAVVNRGGGALGEVFLTSYARFRQLLDADAQATFLPCRLVVICEQEPGSNMDAVVARGQFTMLARRTLVKQPGCNLKLLGLTYRQDRGQDWLKHAVHMISTSPLTLSLDQNVSYTSGRKGPRAERFYRSENLTRQVVQDAIGVLEGQEKVVVYGHADDLEEFMDLAEEILGSAPPEHVDFSMGIQRDIELDISTNLMLTSSFPRGLGTLVLIESGCFSTPLPILNVGMVVSIVTRFPRKIYSNELHFVASSCRGQSRRSLLSQRWTGRGREGLDSAGPARVVEIMDLGEDVSLPINDIHIQQGTHDPLRECFAMVAAYPGTALNLLPIFEGVDEPLDLVVRLRVMGLLVDQGNGFVLTEKGKAAKSFMDREASLNLEAATALASVNVQRMGQKVARSIVRLSLMKQMFDVFVEVGPIKLKSHDEFVSVMRKFAIDSNRGGPGRERIDRGLIWLTWVSFESGSCEVGHNSVGIPDVVRPSKDWPLVFVAAGLKEAMSTLARWEALLQLGPLQDQQRSDWNTPLSPEEVANVEREIARANYSTVLVIPFEAKGGSAVEQETLPAFWLRTNEPAEIQGDFDKYVHATRRAMTKDIQFPPPHKYVLFGGLPLSVSIDEGGRTSVTGLMWFPYDVIKALMGDLEAEDADPWVRAVAKRGR